jgi:glutamyl-tRNA synthetase
MTNSEQTVRVRFAPSPTGFLHVGGARTAIYNALFRLRFGGALVLRIEDTDRARSNPAMTRQLQDALGWLGVKWDEGPFMQSDNVAAHLKRAHELVEADLAYPCFLTSEELERKRGEAKERGESALYDLSAHLTREEIERRLARRVSHTIRFRMPRENTVFQDLIRGDMDVPPDALEDFIIVRSDGTPTYHLSVVCDDIDMGITHVVRGEDHLSNTPKHIRLFEALGAEIPTFAHLPLMLGTDKKRLSKRTGSTSVEDFRDKGILPEALFNYLALLSWSPDDEREILSLEEMVPLFSLDDIGGSAAVFDPEKLSWVNAQYMSGMPNRDILHHLHPFLTAAGLGDADEERLEAAVELHRTRPKNLKDLAESVRPYFTESLNYSDELCEDFKANPYLPGLLGELKGRFAQATEWDAGLLEAALRTLADDNGVKAGFLIHPTRMALTAAKAGPSLFEIVEAMGKLDTFRHLNNFMTYLRSS